MRVFTNIDTIGEETNLQEDVVIALNKEEADKLFVAVKLSYATHPDILTVRDEFTDKLAKVL